MFSHILVYNPIGTLRRLSVQSLRNLGYSPVYEAGTLDEVRMRLESIKSQVAVVIEFNLGQNRETDLSLIDILQNENSLHPLLVVATLQNPMSDLETLLGDYQVRHIFYKNLDLYDHCLKMTQTLDFFFKETLTLEPS